MANTDFHSIEAEGIRLTLDLRVGNLRELVISRDGRETRPLHTAPWVDDAAITEDTTIAPHLRYLSGDFFCAPFGLSDVEPAPAHGWTANSPWRHVETTTLVAGTTARYRLERLVMGATVEKILTLRDGHPYVYETHAFIGGKGALPVANHAMTRFPAGGRIAFSPKAWAETPKRAPEPDPTSGRSVLAYPARAEDARHMPMADGGVADLAHYPIAELHEDFVMLVEAPGSTLGWFAAVRPDSRDVVLSLKRPSDYPVTLMWFSNGGRDYAPWNSRHLRVLGFEEGRTYAGFGNKAAIAPNPLADQGIPTALQLVPDGRVEVRNVVGGLPVEGDAPVASITLHDAALAIAFEDGTKLEVPADGAFLKRN